MTVSPLAVPCREEAGSQRAQVAACAFCRRRLGGEYFFSCIKCGASYCYIHMSRHQPAPCARREGRRLRARSAPSWPLQGEGVQVVLAGGLPADSSANV
jgi:hypothetical protein